MSPSIKNSSTQILQKINNPGKVGPENTNAGQLFCLGGGGGQHMKLKAVTGSSVVECLTGDRGAAGSCLTGVTVLCP